MLEQNKGADVPKWSIRVELLHHCILKGLNIKENQILFFFKLLNYGGVLLYNKYKTQISRFSTVVSINCRLVTGRPCSKW